MEQEGVINQACLEDRDKYWYYINYGLHACSMYI